MILDTISTTPQPAGPRDLAVADAPAWSPCAIHLLAAGGLPLQSGAPQGLLGIGLGIARPADLPLLLEAMLMGQAMSWSFPLANCS